MTTPAERNEPFTVPTCGFANTSPLDMDDQTFDDWLLCIPEERRQDWRYRRMAHRLPWQSTPAENAILVDWRFQTYTVTMRDNKEKKDFTCWAVDEVKAKGRKAKFDYVAFCFQVTP